MTFQRQKVSGLVAMLVDGGRWVVSGLLSCRDCRFGPQNGHMPGAALAVAAAQTSAAWPGLDLVSLASLRASFGIA